MCCKLTPPQIKLVYTDVLTNELESFFIKLFFFFSYLYQIHSSVCTDWITGLMSRVFANGPGDQGSIPGRVIPKTQKMVLDAALLNTQYYKVRIKSKVEQFREGVAPFPTPRCRSY